MPSDFEQSRHDNRQDTRGDSGWDGQDRRSNPARVAEVRLTDKTIEYLEQKIAQAVRDGIKGAITEDTATAFWGAGIAVLQKQAATHTGRFVLGGLWGLARKVLVFVVIGGLVYALGGWGALATLFKTLFSTGG